MNMRHHPAHPLPSQERSWLNDRKHRSDVAKISGVACDNALETAGEGRNQHISNRTLWCLHGSATNLMVIPQLVRQFGIRDGPWLRARDRNDLEEGVRSTRISTECRPNFDECDGANAQAISEMLPEARERRCAPRGVGHDQIQNHRGVHDPSHLIALPLPQISHRFIRRTPWGRRQLSPCGVDSHSKLSQSRDLRWRAWFIRQSDTHTLTFGEAAQQTSNDASAVVANADSRIDRAHACHSIMLLAF